MPEPWWKSAVIYQIYPRSFAQGPDCAERRRARYEAANYPLDSFADTDGDGVGDLEGVRRRLDHLSWLGVDAIWLSPFYKSPMADFGYDVSDYCDVDPLFGTLADFDRLVEEAHEAGIRVIVDWVPNHTSDAHPWFVESRSSRDNPKRDWYWWRDGKDGGLPNNWPAAFGGDAWTFDETTGQWYLHLFLPEQPDLNWWNEDVVDAMHGVLRFWLDRGVDGFRADVIHAIGKSPDLPDMPDDITPIGRTLFHDYERTHELLRDMRRLLESYPGDRMMVGEVYILSTERVATYYGEGDELHLAFNFPPLHAPWDAAIWRRRIDRVIEEMEPRRAWPSWVLSNHDTPRHRTRYGSEARARAAAVMLLSLRGTPFLYAGEELGLEDAAVPPDRVVDPGGRDGCRAPIPWDDSANHGWAGADPWLPWPPDADARSLARQRADGGSILHLYRRLLAARRASPALATGQFEWLECPAGALVYRRVSGTDERTVAVNFTEDSVRVDAARGKRVLVSSDGHGEDELFDGELGPDQGVVLS